MKEAIYEFLQREGIPPNIIGFHYIMQAAETMQGNKKWRLGGENGIYARIAKDDGKGFSWRTVERLCRYAKSKATRYPEMTMKEWLYWVALESNPTRQREVNIKVIVLDAGLIEKCREYGLQTIHEIEEFANRLCINSNSELEDILNGKETVTTIICIPKEEESGEE